MENKSVNTAKPTGWMYQRSLAVVVVVVAIVFASVLGIWKGVRGEYRNVTEAFANGTDGSGYGVAYYRDAMEEHAANLCKIASKSKYDGAFSAPCDAVNDAIYASGSAENVGAMYDAVQAMIQAVDALNLEMAEATLDDADEQYRVAEYQNFTDQFYKARNVAVDYNELARAYNYDVRGGFPASALAGLLRLPTAEEFS